MQRVLFPAITVFWLTMNAWLVRTEFFAERDSGGEVPLAGVWHKILTAPDDSTLILLRQGRRIGHLRWVPNVGEELATGKTSPQDFMPEGAVTVLKDYSIDLDGNLDAGAATRVRFSAGAKFGTNHHWKEFSFKFGNRPSTWVVKASAARKKIEMHHSAFDQKDWERSFELEVLKRPELLLAALGLAGENAPLLPAFLAGPGGGDLKAAGGSLLGRFHWGANQDWLRLGHAKVRTYRIEARLGEGLRATAWISRVGELLKVELPGGVVMMNEALENLPGP